MKVVRSILVDKARGPYRAPGATSFMQMCPSEIYLPPRTISDGARAARSRGEANKYHASIRDSPCVCMLCLSVIWYDLAITTS